MSAVHSPRVDAKITSHPGGAGAVATYRLPGSILPCAGGPSKALKNAKPFRCGFFRPETISPAVWGSAAAGWLARAKPGCCPTGLEDDRLLSPQALRSNGLSSSRISHEGARLPELRPMDFMGFHRVVAAISPIFSDGGGDINPSNAEAAPQVDVMTCCGNSCKTRIYLETSAKKCCRGGPCLFKSISFCIAETAVDVCGDAHAQLFTLYFFSLILLLLPDAHAHASCSLY